MASFALLRGAVAGSLRQGAAYTATSLAMRSMAANARMSAAATTAVYRYMSQQRDVRAAIDQVCVRVCVCARVCMRA